MQRYLLAIRLSMRTWYSKNTKQDGKERTSSARPLRKEDPCMNQKEPFLRRILPYLLNENSHMGLFGPLYLLWHCEYQTCLRWYGLPAALLVLAHGAFGWGIGHKLLPLVEVGCYSMLACVLWMYVINIRFSWVWHKLPHTDRRSLRAPLLAFAGYVGAVALVIGLGFLL